MKSEEQMRSTLPRVYTGSMLPSMEVGHDQHDDLFDIALACVSEVTGTPEEDLMGRRRFQPLCTHRFMLYKLVRHEIGCEHTHPPLSWIGKKMGKDHGSVIHGIDQIEQYLESDRAVEPVYTKVLSRFEIARAEYLSLHLDEDNASQIIVLKRTVATIARAISSHEDHLALMMEQLAKAELKGGSDENMVQDKCSSDG